MLESDLVMRYKGIEIKRYTGQIKEYQGFYFYKSEFLFKELKDVKQSIDIFLMKK